jgi:hypothetical protein
MYMKTKTYKVSSSTKNLNQNTMYNIITIDMKMVMSSLSWAKSSKIKLHNVVSEAKPKS